MLRDIMYMCIYHWNLKQELYILIINLSTRRIFLVQTVNYDANILFIPF
jgi:hypothetical protein